MTSTPRLELLKSRNITDHLPRAGLLPLVVLLCCLTGSALAQPQNSSSSQPAITTTKPSGPGESVFGNYNFELTDLRDPGGVAIGPNGFIYVADTGNHRIKVFNSNGKPVHGWGSRGSTANKMLFPRGIAVASSGDVIVADTGNHRIVTFRPDGKRKRTWGRFGSGDGEFIEPSAVAVNSSFVYVTDTGNDRVEVFDLDGKWKRSIGSFGIEPGRFRRPAGIAVDPHGFLYVVDGDNSRIQKFKSDGSFVLEWGTWGTVDGMLAEPAGIAFHEDRLFVADSNNGRVEVFDPNGAMRYQWGVHAFKPREGAGRFHYPNAVAISPDGRFVVVSEGFENRCQSFGRMPPGAPPPPNPFAGMNLSGSSHYGSYISLNDPLLTLSELETDQVLLFNFAREAPILVTVIGVHGDRAGQFIRPSGLALDSKKSQLYVADSGNRRLHVIKYKLDLTEEIRFIPELSQFVAQLDFAKLKESDTRLKDRPVVEPSAIELDKTGNLYVLDSRQSLILVCNDKLQLERIFGGQGGGKAEFRHPTDIATTNDGRRIYVVDSYNQRVQVLTPEGEFLYAWGDHGPPQILLEEPFGITEGRDESIYVTDTASHRVFKYDDKGRYMKSWGEIGLEDGQMYKPKGIMHRDDGKLIVIDQGNHRGQLFTADGEYLSMFGSRFFTDKALRNRGKVQGK